jgi:hypothetical protein
VKDDTTGAKAAPAAERPAPAERYEPPAISWEEAFEPMAAVSCLLEALNPACAARPTV